MFAATAACCCTTLHLVNCEHLVLHRDICSRRLFTVSFLAEQLELRRDAVSGHWTTNPFFLSVHPSLLPNQTFLLALQTRKSPCRPPAQRGKAPIFGSLQFHSLATFHRPTPILLSGSSPRPDLDLDGPQRLGRTINSPSVTFVSSSRRILYCDRVPLTRASIPAVSPSTAIRGPRSLAPLTPRTTTTIPTFPSSRRHPGAPASLPLYPSPACTVSTSPLFPCPASSGPCLQRPLRPPLSFHELALIGRPPPSPRDLVAPPRPTSPTRAPLRPLPTCRSPHHNSPSP